MNTIYFDNAATTRICEEALAELIECENIYYANASSLHQSAQQADAKIENARDIISSQIGAYADEIIFTSGATESNNALIRGVVASCGVENPHIISTVVEHPSVLNTLGHLEKNGCTVTYLKVNENGMISLDELEKAFCESTILVSVMLSNNEIGTIYPIKEISEIAHSHGALFHCDAVQAVGKIPINVKEFGVDMLSSSAHKFYGPKGVGFMYLRRGVKISPITFGGEQERKLRPGTLNTPGIFSMAAALKVSCEGMAEENKKIASLRDLLKTLLLEKIPNAHINADIENKMAGCLNVSFPDVLPDKMLYALDLQGLRVSAGSACSAGSLEISHVIRAIGAQRFGAPIRFSLGRYNTHEEVVKAAEIVQRVYNHLKNGEM